MKSKSFSKVYAIDDADAIFVLSHFTEEELEVIDRYNKMIGEAIRDTK